MAELFPRTRRGWASLLRRVVALALVVIGGWLVLLGCAERSMLYPARYRPAPAAVPATDGVRELAVAHEQGQTYANLFLGDGVSAASPGPLVIYSHGNGELIEDYPDGLPAYRRMGVSVLMPEYRGCGRSDGQPTKARIDADHVAFYDLAAALPEVDADRIVFHGRSMGCGVLASLARQRRPAALVLESAYTSIKDFARRLLVPGFIVKDNYDVSATLRGYTGPVFMVHSEHDATVPYAMSEKNRAAYAESATSDDKPPLTFVSYAVGHNDPMPPAFYGDVERFLREYGVLAPGSDAGPIITNRPPTR